MNNDRFKKYSIKIVPRDFISVRFIRVNLNLKSDNSRYNLMTFNDEVGSACEITFFTICINPYCWP